MSPTGAVFNIQRFSIHDGPGIRTTVFLKGCALSCFWCHNPEGRRTSLELQFFPDRCTACQACVEACPTSAHEFVDDVHVFHRERCTSTGECVATCFSGALQMNGEIMNVERVMEEVLRDAPFYERSGGGVTLSGGEPSLSTEFAFAILEQCKRQHLHTAIETCGECPWEFLERLLPVTDLVMMDLKLIDPERHRDATGKGNGRVLENARRLAGTGKPLIFRTPLVPTVNDTPEAIGQIASFVRELIDLRSGNGPDNRTGAGVREDTGRSTGNGAWKGESTGTGSGTGSSAHAGIAYELLAFHRLAADKYRSLGMEYRAASIHPPSREQMQEFVAVAASCGVPATFR